MLKDDFKNETKENGVAEKPYRAELEQKYEKELKNYEKKTHFMEEHENEFEDSPVSTISIQGKSEKKKSSAAAKPAKKKEEYLQEAEAAAPISAGEILEKGVEVVTEKAGEVVSAVKSEWKNNRASFVKKTLVGAAVTGAAVGLLVLSARKKKKTPFENALAAI